MKKVCFIVVLFLCSLYMSAQQNRSVHVSEAGTLQAQLTEADAKNITYLSLSGNINAIDFKTMRDNMEKLQIVDLTSVNIRFYTGKKGTQSEKLYVYPLEAIPAYAFRNKKTLRMIILSPSIKNIEDGAFLGCDSLKICQIKKKKAPNLLDNALAPQTTAIFAALGSKDEYRLKKGWENFTILEGKPIFATVEVKKPGNLLRALKELSLKPEQINFLTISGTLDMDDFKEIRDNMPDLVEINLVNTDLGLIPDFAFTQKKYLSWIVFPSKLVTIGERAFSGCAKLRGELLLPPTVKSIGYGAFIGCDNLTKVIMQGEKVTSIGENLFGNESQATLELKGN